MIVDSSAIIAVLRGEPERAAFLETMSADPAVKMSAGNYLETSIVIDSWRDALTSAALDRLLRTLAIEVVPVTAAQAGLARQAHRDFGRGSGHPAKLNFGDCFAYALAIERGETLLFKGKDFTHTGVSRP